MDSATTAKVLDQVDFGGFQSDHTFSRNNELVLGAMAMASYSTPADQKAHTDLQSAIKSLHTLDSADNAQLGIPAPDTGTNLTVIDTDKALLVAARGTSPPWPANEGEENAWSWKDLGADLDAIPVPNYDGDAEVHKGFKDQADGIWEQLKPYLETAVAEHKPIHLAGHSLGAAVALELGDRMHHELGILPQSVLRLGGPDIGWEAEKKHLDDIGLSARTLNVENCGDPVPLVLPGGQTAGVELYLNHNGGAELGNKSHLLDRIEGKALDVLTGHILIPMYRHFPQLYLMGLADPHNAPVLAQLDR